MAVEHQLLQWLFLGNSVVDEFDDDIEPASKTNESRMQFKLHFLHDLESLYWTYLWFIHYRVPVVSTNDENSAKLAVGRDLYFSSPLTGKPGRIGLITNSSNWIVIWEYIYPLYSTRENIIRPVRLNQSISQEYKRIQQVAPERYNGVRRLPVGCFTDHLYDRFVRAFELALRNLSPDGLPVKHAPARSFT